MLSMSIMRSWNRRFGINSNYMQRKWTEEEDCFLRENYKLSDFDEMQKSHH
jgi:hypothetical protein